MASEQSTQFLRPESGPTVEQLEDYRNLMVDTVRAMRKGIKISYRFPDVEFMLPGSYTEWSGQNEGGNVQIERDRSYSASFRNIGMGAHKLVVLETDSVRVPNVNGEGGDRYSTYRRIFRFGWADGEVYDSQGFYTQIISEARPELTLEQFGRRSVSISELNESNDPFRISEHVLVDQAEVDQLTYRTERYSQSFLTQMTLEESLAD